ncbi:hypothetical protein DV515_00014689, partial [Chloebia gouldiae]
MGIFPKQAQTKAFLTETNKVLMALLTFNGTLIPTHPRDPIWITPEVLEQIQNLKELWMDNNSLQVLPGSIGKLKQLVYLDVSKNRIETVDLDISGCEGLEDLLLSSNMLQQLPDSIGLLKRLTTLKVDDNQLTILPNAIG